MKDKTKYCYFCDTTLDKKLFVEHQAKHADELHTVRFSNDMKDVCRTKCKICGRIEKLTNLRNHTKTVHGMVITEYKEKFNQHYFDLVEKILHKCGLCGELLLLDSDCVAKHLMNNKMSHKMTHGEYNAKFMSLMVQSNKTTVVKKQKSKKVRQLEQSSSKPVHIEEIVDIEKDRPFVNDSKQNNIQARTASKDCFICSATILNANHMDYHKNILSSLNFSNDLAEACKATCDDCGFIFPLSYLYEHTKKVHSKDENELKSYIMWKKLKLEEKVFHKCEICRKVLLLDKNIIYHHIKKHDISPVEYRTKFLRQGTLKLGNPLFEGFQNFLGKLSLPAYPALEAILSMNNMSNNAIIETALQVCKE